MHIEIHGPGRAGGALAIAAERSGHVIVGIKGRSDASVRSLAEMVTVIPDDADLRIIAVADDAISDLGEQLAAEPPIPTIHISGSVPVDVLAPIGATGAPIGSFHPLQTLPDPVTGADRLPGAWVAVTAEEPFRESLDDFAVSLGCRPFPLDDDHKALYHAAAASAANFTIASLSLAQRLFEEAGVPFEASKPLVEAIVANAFTLGPREALTGPIARGDVTTVRRQIEAVAETGEKNLAVFRDLARATARTADASSGIDEAIG
jgi:predicted short-subunit dehydrogenase-like oxidoreductase (DUF2520 family)